MPATSSIVPTLPPTALPITAGRLSDCSTAGAPVLLAGGELLVVAEAGSAAEAEVIEVVEAADVVAARVVSAARADVVDRDEEVDVADLETDVTTCPSTTLRPWPASQHFLADGPFPQQNDPSEHSVTRTSAWFMLNPIAPGESASAESTVS